MLAYISGTLPRVPNFSLWKSHMNVIVIIYKYVYMYLHSITYMKIGKPNTNSFRLQHSKPLIPWDSWSARTISVAIAGWHHRPSGDFPSEKILEKNTPVFFWKKNKLRDKEVVPGNFYQVFAKISKGLNVCGGMSSYRLQLICSSSNLATGGALPVDFFASGKEL